MCVCNAIICNKRRVYYIMQNLSVMCYKTPIDCPYSGNSIRLFSPVAVTYGYRKIDFLNDSHPSGKTDVY